ncbi:hypothetical protein BJX99DRAFT_263950 [Aspergillus californicus]
MKPEGAPKKPTRKGKAKVKSGCRTCKTRKVKCDEHFPVCDRCISTGRVCDGYGVWGGGGNHYSHRRSLYPREILDYPSLTCMPNFVASTDEKSSFDWFKGRTIIKIPGSYLSDFWTTILLQATQTEQAVWHATMALSFTHRVGFVQIGSDHANILEQSTLRHCIKAVRLLNPHFTARDRASSRVVLIVCLIFLVLDLIRGHFSSAQVHLRNGLRILGETQARCFSSFPESIDDAITEAFFRLNTQVSLLQYQNRPWPCISPSPLHSEPTYSKFSSYTAAWRGLDHLMNETFHLSAQAREHPPDTTILLSHQKHIQTGLNAWLRTYTNSHSTLRLSPNKVIAEARSKVHRLVISYHTMLMIMTETALYPHNETIFDTQTSRFTELINTLSEVWTISIKDPSNPMSAPTRDPTTPSSQDTPADRDSDKDNPRNRSTDQNHNWIGTCDMSHTIIDMGWMPPLFYAATKCRDRRIRRSAIRLLESTNHREGIWDAKITACIARRVMEIEEGDFYYVFDEGSGGHDGMGDVLGGGQEDITVPMLPESCRIRDLEVKMEGDPLERVLLFGGWEGMGSGGVCIGEYHVWEQRWL